MKGITITPIGSVDSEVLRVITGALEETFNCRVELGNGISVPQDSYNPSRDQYHSTRILEKIGAAKSTEGLVLGAADVDLYVPGLNFVFGEADVYAEAAIISLTRLRPGFYGLKQDRRLFHERAIKEAVHEIGHTCGLGHCPNPRCIMHFSNSLADTDFKGPGFCDICKSKAKI